MQIPPNFKAQIMSTNAVSYNNTNNDQFSDFDGFVDQAPYCYSWTTNAKGVKVPIFPYVISILGHLNLKKLGIEPETETPSMELMKKTLKVYLEQVIGQWQKKFFFQKKIDFPLMILINIADKIGELVTEVVEQLQDKYPFVRLIAVLPLPKNEFIKVLKEENESPEKIRAFENRCNKFLNSDVNSQKYLWELSEKELPHIAEQPKLKKWRMFNEFVASHSHLMVVFWQGEKDNWKDQEDSLTWAVRYKLEGYPGLSRNEETDLITYPATGPVLHIQTDAVTLKETIKNPDKCLPVHYYSGRAIITKEIKGKRELIISDPKFLDLEELRHSWFNKNLSDVGKRPEILNNCKILKELNYTCLDALIPLKNLSLRSFIEDFVIKKYEKSKKEIAKEDIPETDNPTGQFIAHYCIIDELADFFKEKTRRLVNGFCRVFLILLILNAFLIFLNDLCNMGFGVNIFRLTHYYATQWFPNQFPQAGLVDSKSLELLNCAIDQNIAAAPNNNLDNIISTSEINVFRIIGFFLITLLGISICIIRIIYFCYQHYFKSWHYKYHQFRMLADCLRVQVFWKIAGMEYSVSTNFRSHQMPAMDWLFMVLNGFKVCIPNSIRIEREKLKPRMKLLDTIWLEDRLYYFDSIFKKKYFTIVWESLTLFSKLVFIGAVSTLFFIPAFFIA
ncbi:MAG: hypothetical protein IKW80_10135, partial [Thermoguttaceae bacterium]|nr:hypothetical protein [Thermoguttaceae bacterium]